MLTQDINCIHFDGSCFSDPLKCGTRTLAQYTTVYMHKFAFSLNYIYCRILQNYLSASTYVYILYLREKGPTTEYRPTPHFGLNFLLRSKDYSNMRPYVSAMEHTCAITIKLAWLRSIAVQVRSIEAQMRHKTN